MGGVCVRLQLEGGGRDRHGAAGPTAQGEAGEATGTGDEEGRGIRRGMKGGGGMRLSV